MDQYYALCLDFKFCSRQIKRKRSSILYSNCKLSMFQIKTVFKERLWSRILKISKLATRIATALWFSKLLLTVFSYTKKQILKAKTHILRNTDVNLHGSEQCFSAFTLVNRAEFGLTLLKQSHFPQNSINDTEYILTI